MQIINYDKLYSLPASALDYLDDNDMKKFLFQGSTNWDLYFNVSLDDDDVAEFTNVSLLVFNNKKEFKKYLDANKKIIDYSLEHVNEHGKYYVLVEGKKV